MAFERKRYLFIFNCLFLCELNNLTNVVILYYKSGKSLYLDGEALLQPYCGPRSTETRLVVRCDDYEPAPPSPSSSSSSSSLLSLLPVLYSSLVPSSTGHRLVWYDHEVYEQRCFYFNTVLRKGSFSSCLKEAAAAGLGDTWDHAVEAQILLEFCKKRQQISSSSLLSLSSSSSSSSSSSATSGIASGVLCVEQQAVTLSSQISDALGWRDDWTERATNSSSSVIAKKKVKFSHYYQENSSSNFDQCLDF